MAHYLQNIFHITPDIFPKTIILHFIQFIFGKYEPCHLFELQKVKTYFFLFLEKRRIFALSNENVDNEVEF